MSSPLVSVIIPAFNRPRCLKSAINSVLQQTFTDFELIVVDDGSTECLAECQRVVEGAGQHFVKQAHAGVSAARNHGVRCAQGVWLSFLDSDDLWHEEKLERQIKHLQENPKLKIAQCAERWIRSGKFVNPRNKHKKPNGEAFFASLKLCCISPSAVILTRELFDSVGGFDEGMCVCEDYDLWLRITSANCVGLLSEELVTKHGGHADQLSHSEPAMDRFRLYSLAKLLMQCDLNARQRLAVIEEIQAKSEVLRLGAEKRANEPTAAQG